jgi:hypothetical protein
LVVPLADNLSGLTSPADLDTLAETGGAPEQKPSDSQAEVAERQETDAESQDRTLP